MKHPIYNDLGCGYCMYELICDVRRKDTNLARAGCPCYSHFSNIINNPPYSKTEVTNFINNIPDATNS